jgi:hypothetical protein
VIETIVGTCWHQKLCIFGRLSGKIHDLIFGHVAELLFDKLTVAQLINKFHTLYLTSFFNPFPNSPVFGFCPVPV